VEGIQLGPALPKTKTISLCLQQPLKVLWDILVLSKMIDVLVGVYIT